MILFGNHVDPSMRYEGLYRFAFGDCGKQEDPWGEAAQDHYPFLDEDLSNGKANLFRILHKLIFDSFKSDSHKKTSLIEIEKSIELIKTQNDAIKIIDETIAIIDQY